jgi:hypothetical protein
MSDQATTQSHHGSWCYSPAHRHSSSRACYAPTHPVQIIATSEFTTTEASTETEVTAGAHATANTTPNTTQSEDINTHAENSIAAPAQSSTSAPHTGGFLSRIKAQIAKEESGENSAADSADTTTTDDASASNPFKPSFMTKSNRWKGAASVIRKASNMSMAFKPRLAQKALQSFVALQLANVLQSSNPEIDVQNGTTYPGAVLFSDASGFTKLTTQLANEVFLTFIATRTSSCLFGGSFGRPTLCALLANNSVLLVA